MPFIGKRAFIAGVADDNGYGWAVAKSLAAAGAEILVGTWVPVSKFEPPLHNHYGLFIFMLGRILFWFILTDIKTFMCRL